MNGDIISQIQCAPQSAFSMSLHPSGVITTYNGRCRNGRNYEIFTYVMSHGKFKQYIKILLHSYVIFQRHGILYLNMHVTPYYCLDNSCISLSVCTAPLPTSKKKKKKKEKKEKGKGIFSEIYSTFICLELLYWYYFTYDLSFFLPGCSCGWIWSSSGYYFAVW